MESFILNFESSVIIKLFSLLLHSITLVSVNPNLENSS